MSHWGLFIGRFHPLAVHLPIGILLVLAVLELSTMLNRDPRLAWLPALGDGPRGLILGCALLAAATAAGMGWLLARSGEYDPGLVSRHRIFGIAVAILTVLLLALHGRRWRRVYGVTLAAAFVALIAAGHTGGSLTHGANFLTEYFPGRARALPLDPRGQPAYAGLIQPLLTERCASCHGPAKTNGDLRLDNWAALLKGGKHGAVFKPGDSGVSRLILRVDAPLEEKGHMPPKGKPQVTDDEATLLRWWIDSGAPERKTLGEMMPPPDVAAVLANRFGLVAWGAPPPDRTTTLAAAAAVAARLGIVARPLTPDGPWLAVNARVRSSHFGDPELAQLASLGPALQWLDLGDTAVTDRGLGAFAGMTHLRRLDLDHTAVTDAGLARLAPLGQLEYLNLYGTAVSDAGLDALRALPSLRSLYLWQTRVTPAAADALATRLTDRRKLQRWHDQMAELQNKIRGETFYYNLGAPVAPAVVKGGARPSGALHPRSILPQ